jgi:hypothetical protein
MATSVREWPSDLYPLSACPPRDRTRCDASLAPFACAIATDGHKCAGIYVIAPNKSEVFIPQSLLPFDIPCLTADEPAILPLAPTPGPSGVVTLLCELFKVQLALVHFVNEWTLATHATATFEGRTCKACQGKDVHTEHCPTLQSDDYVCPWCSARGGGHSFRCNGFV